MLSSLMKFRALLLWMAVLYFLGIGQASAISWTGSGVAGGVAYFITDYQYRVERFDLAAKQWLPTITLPNTHGFPSTGTVDEDGMYVAFSTSVYRYDLNGGNEVFVANLGSSVSELFTDGNLLLASCSVNTTQGKFASIDKSTNAVIATLSAFYGISPGGSISRAENRILGSRHPNISPGGLVSVRYTDAGQFIGQEDDPYHGDYPRSSRAWVLPGDGRVVDDSGTMYSVSALKYLAGNLGAITDIEFYEGNLPIVLRGLTLQSFTSGFVPLGSYQLPAGTLPKCLYLAGEEAFVFAPGDNSNVNIRVDVVPLSVLPSPAPMPTVDPRGAEFIPGASFVGNDGLVYLLSGASQSLFRWDPTTQDFLSSIPLVGVPDFVSYSSVSNTVYLAFHDGVLRKISLADPAFTELPFVVLANEPRGLAAVGAYVFTAEGEEEGNSFTNRTFNAAGVQRDSEVVNRAGREYIWSSANQRVYFLDDNISNSIYAQQINASGTAYAIPAGAIGSLQSSDTDIDSYQFQPLRISPDGANIIVGTGEIFSGAGLALQPASLSNAFKDAAWLGNELYTIQDNAGAVRLQKWANATYIQTAARSLPGTAYSLLSLDSTRLLAITQSAAGIPRLDIMDSNFATLPPPSLAAPTGLKLVSLAVGTVNLGWSDVPGDNGYTVERKTGAEGAWSVLGTVGADVGGYADSTALFGNSYLYRVTAFNGALTSGASAELPVDFTIPVAPADFRAAGISSSHILLAWSPVPGASQYKLQWKNWFDPDFSNLITVDADEVTYDSGPWVQSQDYVFRVLAVTPLGISLPSTEYTACTYGNVPAAVVIASSNITENSLRLSWTDGAWGNNGSSGDNADVEMRLTSDADWAPVAQKYRGFSYQFNGLIYSTSYTFRVRVRNGLGAGPWREYMVSTTAPLPPAVPSFIYARPFSASQVNVFWQNVAAETGYHLERRIGTSSSWDEIAAPAADVTCYEDTSVVSGTRYQYRVKSNNALAVSSAATAYSQVLATTPVTLLEDDFDPNIIAANWFGLTGSSVIGGQPGFRTGKALWFGSATGTKREAVTVPLNVAAGGNLGFALRAGNTSVDGATYWETSGFSNSILVEFSIDGNTWNQIIPSPDMSNAVLSWKDYSYDIPVEARTSTTRFRWRQSSHGGLGNDQWALDDIVITTAPPPVPSAPFIVQATPTGSTSVSVLWQPATYATSYSIERLAAGTWAPVGRSSSASFTDTSASPSTLYQFRVKSVNETGTSSSSPSSNPVRTWSRLMEWRKEQYGTTTNSGAAADNSHNGDGYVNILKYAFNLNASEPYTALISETGTKGFPQARLNAEDGRLEIEYLRRRATIQPGISYAVKAGTDFGTWTAVGTETATTIDTTWERVIWKDAAAYSPGTRCARVEVLSLD